MLGMLTRLTCQGVSVKPRPGPSGNNYSVCCLLCVLLVMHLRSDARQVCTSLVNSATVSFVESECDVLRVHMCEGVVVVVDMPEQQECQLSVNDLPSQ